MMKRFLAILIALIMIIPANTAFVFAGAMPENILYSEDFSAYDEGGALPSGWSWTSVADTTTVDSNPEYLDDSHGTALRITSEGTEVSYMKTAIPQIDMTKGVVKLSFQLYFEEVGMTAGSSQQIHAYIGTSTPLVKGVRVANGVVGYANSASERWSHKSTTTSIFPKTWYTFDVINDFDNNRTSYFVDGKPLCDAETGEVVVTECYTLGSSSTVSDLYILSRTRHTDAENGGDVLIDNITVSSTQAGGVFVSSGSEVSEVPDYLDVRFSASIDRENFDKDSISVKKCDADDVLMQYGSDIPFEITELGNASCRISFADMPELANFEKIKVDFGSNTDCRGKKLSYTYVVKMPEAAEEVPAELLYDSEVEGDYPVELAPHRVDITDYDYNYNGESKTGIRFTTLAGSSPSPTVRLQRADGGALVEEGYEYDISFRMKIAGNSQSLAGKEHKYRFSGEFDTEKDENGTKLYNAGAIQMFYLTNGGVNGYYDEGTKGLIKWGFSNAYNKNASIANDFDALFENTNWLDVDIKYYPDTKSWDYTVRSEIGSVEKHENVEASYWDTTFATKYVDKYTSANIADLKGKLKGFRFYFSADNLNMVIDDLKIERREAVKTSATVKSVIFRDEQGNLLQAESGLVAPGAKKIEVAFDGTVDPSAAADIFLSGSNVPAYSGEFDAVTNVYTASFEEIMGGSADYSINFPESLNLNYGIGSVAFSTEEGKTEISSPEIVTGGTDAYAKLYTRNTSFEANTPSTLVVASYKGGTVTDIKTTGLVASPCSYGDIATDSVAATDADTIKAFALENSTLTHISDYAVKALSKVSASGEKKYSFSGSDSGKYVTAVLMNPSEADKTVPYTFAELSADNAFSYIDAVEIEDGEYSFGFDIDGKSGKYQLYVVSADGNIIDEKTIYYADEIDSSIAQKKVAEAAKSETSAQMSEVIEEYSIELGLAGEDVFADADMEYVAGELYEYVKKNGIDTADKKTVKKVIGDICLEVALEEGKISDIAVYSDVAGVFETEPVATWYAKNIADSKKITARLSGKKIDNLSDGLMEAIALEIIDAGKGYAYVRDLCELLEDEIGIDSDKGTNSVYRSIDGKYYANYKALADDFKSLTAGSGSSGGSGGGGSKGGSKGSSIGNVAIGGVASEQTVAPIKEYVFKDIASYEWAADSITELYEKNIVSGRGEGIFAPGDAVLREEFVKMITEAFAISGTTDTVFEDVSESDWFKPYIDRACGAGIVNGEGSTFGAGKPITRQDMAKIIFGTLSKAGIELKAADISIFADGEQIAQYALEGVSALYGAGIIKGKSADSFAPTDNATRAETAVIISRALALIK